MPYLLKVSEEEITEKEVYLNAKGNAECVEFVRQTTNAPGTPKWQKGIRVADAKLGQIKRGTAIATFDDKGHYPVDSRGRHAAIYLSHDRFQITVLDQWNSKGKVTRRGIQIGKKATSRSNDGATFYVIE